MPDGIVPVSVHEHPRRRLLRQNRRLERQHPLLVTFVLECGVDGALDAGVVGDLNDAESRVPQHRVDDGGNVRHAIHVEPKVEVDQKGGLGAVDPVRPLAWMIDHAVRERGGIRKGQVITTGSWTGLRYYPPGSKARGEFVGLGAVEASF